MRVNDWAMCVSRVGTTETISEICFLEFNNGFEIFETLIVADPRLI
jgi:hypothetical protein